MPSNKTLENKFQVTLERIHDFEFVVRFPQGDTVLHLDEPPPLGHNRGPNASRILTTAVANCLSASLLFCLQKSRHPVAALSANATTTLKQNERGRWRVDNIAVELTIALQDGSTQALQHCLGLFEDFCIVTESVRRGIPVSVAVVDDKGNKLNAG